MAQTTINTTELTQEQVSSFLVAPLEEQSQFLAAGPKIFDTANAYRRDKTKGQGAHRRNIPRLPDRRGALPLVIPGPASSETQPSDGARERRRARHRCGRNATEEAGGAVGTAGSVVDFRFSGTGPQQSFQDLVRGCQVVVRHATG